MTKLTSPPTDTSEPRVLRIATRKSPLAMWQAEHVAALLSEHGQPTQLVPLVSKGDVDMRPIDGMRQVGLFTKRIQEALLDDEADVAVHSLKDLPTEVDPRLVLAAVPGREDVSDCLVSPSAWNLEELPQGAKIGTGSRRRAAQLLHARPDLQLESIRGNVQTRLAKLDAGEFDAIMLAEAGLLRLEMHDLPRHPMPLGVMLPAPGQGALGIEVRSEDSQAIKALSNIDHLETRTAVAAERTLLANLNGGCLAPIAAYGQCSDGSLSLQAIVLSVDGSQKLEQSGERELSDLHTDEWPSIASELAGELSERLAQAGARELIQVAR